MSALAPVAALLVGVAILVMGNGLQSTLLPVRAQIESFSLLEIGILGSAYFVGFAIGCLTGSRLIHRAGHIRVFTAMAAVASAVALAHALIVLPVIWWPLRAITGFCFAILYIVIESWLNERSLPFRLTPMTATCRVPPLSRVKLGIGWSRGVARDAEQ